MRTLRRSSRVWVSTVISLVLLVLMVAPGRMYRSTPSSS